MKRKRSYIIISVLVLLVLTACSNGRVDKNISDTSKKSVESQTITQSSISEEDSQAGTSTSSTKSNNGWEYTADNKKIYGLNEPATINKDDKPIVSVEIVKASARISDIYSEKDYLSFPLSSVIRLDIRFTNYGANNFNYMNRFYSASELHSDTGNLLNLSVQYQPDGQPDTVPLEVGKTGVVQVYFILDNNEKNMNVNKIKLDYFYVKSLVNLNIKDDSSVVFEVPVEHGE